MIKLARNPDYQLKRKRDLLVLWHKNKGQRVGCNDSAALVWHFADENISATEIADRVQDFMAEVLEYLRDTKPNLLHVIKARRANDYCQNEWFYLHPYLAGLVDEPREA
ncbi:MAG: hypothetical protein DHS20C01_35340 [marine bacterium B5-7]|nr:MAG: hypothetical protein DHS20C01_35340 [marine bacterium B5-7]